MAPPLNPKEVLLKVAPRLPLFAGLGIGVMEDLIKCGSLLSIKQGEQLAKESEKADSFFVILSGEAVVEKKVKTEVVKIATLVSGDCVGEMSLISPEPRSATVTATKDSLVFKVYEFKLKMFPGLVSELYLNIARILEQRLRKNNYELASLTVKMNGLEGEEVATDDPFGHEAHATWLTNSDQDLKGDLPEASAEPKALQH